MKISMVLPLDRGPTAAVIYAHGLMDQAWLQGPGPVQMLWLELTLCLFSFQDVWRVPEHREHL